MSANFSRVPIVHGSSELKIYRRKNTIRLKSIESLTSTSAKGFNCLIDVITTSASLRPVRHYAQKTRQQPLEGRSAWTNSAVTLTAYDDLPHRGDYDFKEPVPTYRELLIIIASNVSRRNNTVKPAHVRESEMKIYQFITLVLDFAFSPRILPARL